MIQQIAKVLWNKKVGPSCHRLGLETGKGYLDAKPGQFVTVKTEDGFDPLLRRPFSIHRLIAGNDKIVQGIEVLFKVVGRSTMQFSKLKPEDSLSLLGPLGQGFSIPESHRKIIMVAGGIGIAPFLFLAEFLAEKGIDASCCKVLIGGRTKQDLLCIDDFKALNIDTHISTDDGSCGHKGLITDLLKEAMEENKPDIIFACGPHLMLKAVAGIANRRSIRCQISLETIMVCGVGACLGCAVKVKDDSGKYGHVCVDGPVFDSRNILID